MRFKLSKVIILILILLIGGFLFYSVKETQELENERVRHMAELKAQAEPYEQEMEQIRQEIASYGVVDENEIIIPDRGKLMIGYQMSTHSDISTIREQVKKYRINPVLILNCSLPYYINDRIVLGTPNDAYEVVFTATTFDETTMENLARIRENMKNTILIDTNTFLLRGNADTETNRAFLLENGFSRCLRITNGIANEANEEGLSCIGYADMNSRDADTIKTSLEACVQNVLNVMYIFDMTSWPYHKDNIKVMNSYLDNITAYTSDGRLIYSGVNEAFEDLMVRTRKADQELMDYDSFLADRQARLAELEAAAQEIYSQWDQAATETSSVFGWIRK